MILTNSIDATAHQIGDEIWDTPLTDAIRAEAEKTVYHVPTSIVRLIGQERLIACIAHDMSTHLRSIGDTYAAPDGVIYTLKTASLDTEDRYAPPMPDLPVVVAATFEQMPHHGPRKAIVSWSDGTTSEAARWFPDELLICEGDLIGKTQEQICSLHFRRDHDWLQS